MSSSVIDKIKTANFPIPATGQLQEVATGIFWLRMPLPFKLDHINLYLLDDVDGWVVIDCGLNNETTLDIWQQIEDRYFAGKPVKRIIATHAHVDHLGAAGALCRRWNCPLWITEAELATAKSYLNQNERSTQYPEFFQPLGINKTQSENMGKLGASLGRLFSPIPEDIRYLEHNETFTIGRYQWQIIVAEGHCAAHAVLYCAEAKILISGDQVLPGISSNVSVRIDEPDGNPLHHWLESIENLFELAEETLVFPAHEQPFYGLHTRLEELKHEHHETLDTLTEHCSDAKNVLQLLKVLYKRELGPFDTLLATGECLAHLHYLLDKKRLLKTINSQGHFLFQTL